MKVEFQCKKCAAFLAEESNKKGHAIKCSSCGFEIAVPLQGSIEVGNIIEDHLIQKEIGHGAMGTVYLASHLLMNRQVAIKTISSRVRQEKDAVDHFIKELQMGAQLSHPNIVTVYNAGYTEGVYYISMQYIDGLDMNKKVETAGPLTEKEALNVINKVADAMSYAWNEFRMIHRDLKPENIRINNRGDIMILDFGLAKMRSNEAEKTEDGLIVGTPDFMSPEQAEGLSDIDFRADMYALGVVLIYLLTGKRPFQSPDPLDVVAMHMNKPMPSLKELNPSIQVSKGTIDLINTMTSKDRNDRFIGWEEVSEAINRISNNEKTKSASARPTKTISSSSSSRSVRTSAPKGRRRYRSSSNFGTMVAVLIFLALVLLAVFVYQNH